jgi:hypothetical protein
VGQQPEEPRVPTLLPGVRVNTSPTTTIRCGMQLQRWEGQGYVRFGNIIGAQISDRGGLETGQTQHDVLILGRRTRRLEDEVVLRMVRDARQGLSSP